MGWVEYRFEPGHMHLCQRFILVVISFLYEDDILCVFVE